MAGARAREATRLELLDDERAALRRVATLLAQGAPVEKVFALVAAQVAEVLRVPMVSVVRIEADGTATERARFSQVDAIFGDDTSWSLEGSSVVAQVRRTGHAARIDDQTDLTGEPAETARRTGIRSTVGIPIFVAGRPWGVMVVSSPDVLPPDTASRLADFTELVAMAIASGEAREEVQRLADEQAALRHVATLVAKEAPLEDVFAKVAEEVACVLGDVECGLLRDEGDGTARIVAISDTSAARVGTRLSLDDESVTSVVLREARPARIGDYSGAAGDVASDAQGRGLRSSVGCPIVVGARTWGVMAVATREPEPLAPDAEARIARFSELVATAIANTEARAQVERLLDEQAALRRVAMFVAKDAPPREVFAKVAEEVGKVLGDGDTSLWRDEGDGTATIVATSGVGPAVGTRMPIDGDGVIATVLREARPHWMADIATRSGAIVERGRELGITSAIGCPVLVGGRVWGALGAAKADRERFRAGTEARLAQFAELVATAIANADARAEVQRLADEQAALRRVATLVASGASPPEVFDAVAAEVMRLLGTDGVVVARYEPADEITFLAHRGLLAQLPLGTRMRHDGRNVSTAVRRTERPARIEGHERTGDLTEFLEELGEGASVGVPIVVDGRLWGVVIATWQGKEPPAAVTEERMAHFAELLDTAVANADARGQLTASRARLLTAGNEARRRVVRDLHDGAQQRLVHAIVTLKLARQALEAGDGGTDALLREALEHTQRGNAELRELAHGIIPASLSHGGLRAGIDAVVDRVALAVEVDVTAERFPPDIEASAYFVVAEALTNVVKHARATRTEVSVAARDGTLRVEIRDDGIGGADPAGHGLIGLGDRAAALGGRLDVADRAGGGTVVTAELPLRLDAE
jgi:GAF domain-containing protein